MVIPIKRSQAEVIRQAILNIQTAVMPVPAALALLQIHKNTNDILGDLDGKRQELNGKIGTPPTVGVPNPSGAAVTYTQEDADKEFIAYRNAHADGANWAMIPIKQLEQVMMPLNAVNVLAPFIQT